MQEKPKQRDLSRRQEAALLAMIEPSNDGSALSLVEISRNIGVNPATLWRWRTQNETFMRRYRDLRRGLVEAAIARLQGLMDKAIDTLEKNLATGNRPSECRAASTIIRQAIEGVDALDFEERISAIEKRFSSSRSR